MQIYNLAVMFTYILPTSIFLNASVGLWNLCDTLAVVSSGWGGGTAIEARIQASTLLAAPARHRVCRLRRVSEWSHEILIHSGDVIWRDDERVRSMREKRLERGVPHRRRVNNCAARLVMGRY